MAEELGIDLDELNLTPKANDKTLLTPANHANFKPTITVDTETPKQGGVA